MIILVLLIINFLRHINSTLIYDESKDFKQCHQEIIGKLLNYNDFLVVTDNAYLFNDIRLNNPHLILNINFKTVETYYSNHQMNYILLTDNINTLKVIMQKLQFNQNDSNLKTCLLFMRSVSSYDDIFTYLWKKSIHNIILAVETENTIKLYTSYPFDSFSRCGQRVIIRQIGNCSNIQHYAFPKYPTNFIGCNITYQLAANMAPKLIMDMNNGTATGLLIEPAYLLTHYYNLNVTYQNLNIAGFDQVKMLPSEKLEQLNICTENSTLLTVWPLLIGTPKNCELTNIAYSEEKCWFLLKPNKMSNIKIITSIFGNKIWICIIAAYIVFSTTLIFFYKYKQNIYHKYAILFDIFKLTIGISVTVLPKSFTLRILLFFYMYYSTHVNYFFQGGLSSVLTTPIYEKGINTVEELADSDYIPIVASYLNKDAFKVINNSAAMKIYNKTVIFDSTENLFHIKQNEVITTYCSGGIQFTEAEKENMVKFRNSISPTAAIRLLMKKGSPVISALNRILNIVKEQGLELKWKNDLKTINFVNSTNDLVVLEIQHLFFGFVILSSGLLCAFMILVCEIVVSKRV